MLTILNRLPNYDLALHVRRTNKIRDIGNTEFEIKPSERLELDTLTRQILVKKSENVKKIFICGDSENETNYYKHIVSTKVVTTPYVSNSILHKLFFDFFALGRAQHVIVSQRYSSFSMTSALVHGRSITVVLAQKKMQKTRPCIFGECKTILNL